MYETKVYFEKITKVTCSKAGIEVVVYLMDRSQKQRGFWIKKEARGTFVPARKSPRSTIYGTTIDYQAVLFSAEQIDVHDSVEVDGETYEVASVDYTSRFGRPIYKGLLRLK